MSELRKECQECLNNEKCFNGADYGSIYCMCHRKYDLKNIDFGKEESKQTTDILININTVKSKAKNLEELYKKTLENGNSTQAFVLKCQIEAFKDFEKEILNNK